MNDKDKIEVIDETFTSFYNLMSLWNKVKDSKEAKLWLQESWNDIEEDLTEDDKTIITEEV